jgi:hypothetical protein
MLAAVFMQAELGEKFVEVIDANIDSIFGIIVV